MTDATKTIAKRTGGTAARRLEKFRVTTASLTRSRIAWLAAAGLVASLCAGAFGSVPERVSAEFTLIKPALAGDPGSAASPQSAAGAGIATDGHAMVWRVVAAAGSPVYRQLEQNMTDWQPVPVGLTLETYAEFDTGTGGRLELFNGNDRVTLAPSTTVALPPAMDDAADVTILQNSGQAEYKVRTRRQPSDGLIARFGQLFLTSTGPAGRFDVYTPYLVAAVKGTAFTVSVDDEGASVSVTEGVVHVTDTRDGSDADVKTGKMAKADASTGHLALGDGSRGRKKGDSQGGDSQGGDSQGGNGQGGNGQGGNGQGGNDNSH